MASISCLSARSLGRCFRCRDPSQFDTPVGSGKSYSFFLLIALTHELLVIVQVHFEDVLVLVSPWTLQLQLSHNQSEDCKREYGFAFCCWPWS